MPIVVDLLERAVFQLETLYSSCPKAVQTRIMGLLLRANSAIAAHERAQRLRKADQK